MSLLRSYLEANAILAPAQLEAAARHQQAQGGSLDTALLELGLLGAGELDLHLGRACGLPTVPARLLETGPTRPWGHVPKALLDIGWALPLALEDGNVLVAVHPDLPDARLGQLYRQIRGFMPMVAMECCLAKLAAERSNSIVAPRFAMLMLDVLDALQAREASAATPPLPAEAPVAADPGPAMPPPAPGDTLLASAIRRLPAEDNTSSGSFSAASSGTFAAVALAAHESGSFAASSSGTFPDLRTVGAHAPGTRHGPEPTPKHGTPLPTPTPVPSASSPAPVPSASSPAPVPSAASPAPVPSASSPAPVPSAASPAPVPSAISTAAILAPGQSVPPASHSAASVTAAATLARPGQPATTASQPVSPVSPAGPASLVQPGSPVSPAPTAASHGQPVPSASHPVSPVSSLPAAASASQPVSPVSPLAGSAAPARPGEPRGWQPEPPSPESERAAQLAQRLAPVRAALASANERDRITEALVRAAIEIAPRAALFGVRREGLRVVPTASGLKLPGSLVIPLPEGGLLDRAVLGLIRLKLLAEPRLAAAVGRPLGIPCLFEPVFAQERGVLMLYLDRDGGQFDGIDHAAVRDLCDLASANLEAILRSRAVAGSRPVDAAQPTASASQPSPAAAPPSDTRNASQPVTAAGTGPTAAATVTDAGPAAPAASGPTVAATTQAAAPVSQDRSAPRAAAPVSQDSSASRAAAPVSQDSSAPRAAAPVRQDSSASRAPAPASPASPAPAAAAPVSPASPTAPAGSAGQPRAAGSARTEPEVDVPQPRPGRAARAAKRQVISLINPIRRDNSGGHSAPPAARAEPRAIETLPTPPTAGPQPVLAASPPGEPDTAPAAGDSGSGPAVRPPTEPDASTPTAESGASTPTADARPVSPSQPVPADRPRRVPSTPIPTAGDPRRSSAMVSGEIVDREAPTPLDRYAVTRAEPQAQPASAAAAPVPTDSPAAAAPVPADSPAAAPVPADSPATGTDHPAAASPVPTDSQPAASPVPTDSPSAASTSQATAPSSQSAASPVPTDSSSAASPVPTDSPAAAPPGLHLPNLVAPGRRGLGKKGDRARQAESGLVMPDLRRPASPGSTTPTLSIPSSLIAPTPLPGAQRRGSRTGLYPVPPRADEITLNMPRLVRDDVAARPAAPAASLSSGTASAGLSSGTASAGLSSGTAAADASPLAGVVMPAELTRKPASAPTPASAASPAEPASDATVDPTAGALSAETSATAGELSPETSATAAIVEAIADAMSASALAADLEDQRAAGQAVAEAPEGPAQDPDAVIEAYLNAPGDAEARAALLRLGPAGLERIAARFPGPIELGDQSDARSFPPPSAHGPLLRACVEIGPPITPYILALLDYPRPQLRFYAAFVFQELRDPRCLRALAEHAFDPDADVRLIATRVLESYSRVDGFIAATELVRAELRSRDRERALLAAEAAGTLRDTQAVHTLIELLSVRDKQVRETALEALCSITAKHLGYRPAKWRAWYDEHGQETRVEWVIEALRHRDAAVRRWAADELVRITGHRVTAPAGEKMTAKYLYQAWQQWWAAGTADRGS